MGAGDLDLESFRNAGRTLFSLGLVKESEGNLSTWDGSLLLITRTGCRLFELTEADVLQGSLEQLPEGASSDASLHLAEYQSRGPGCLAHAHPPGTVPSGWVEGEPHGDYVFAATLDEAVEGLIARARSGVKGPAQ